MKTYRVIKRKDGSTYQIEIPTNATDNPLRIYDEVIMELDDENKRLRSIIEQLTKIPSRQGLY